jgi:hypothetical protein
MKWKCGNGECGEWGQIFIIEFEKKWGMGSNLYY